MPINNTSGTAWPSSHLSLQVTPPQRSVRSAASASAYDRPRQASAGGSSAGDAYDAAPPDAPINQAGPLASYVRAIVPLTPKKSNEEVS